MGFHLIQNYRGKRLEDKSLFKDTIIFYRKKLSKIILYNTVIKLRRERKKA